MVLLFFFLSSWNGLESTMRSFHHKHFLHVFLSLQLSVPWCLPLVAALLLVHQNEIDSHSRSRSVLNRAARSLPSLHVRFQDGLDDVHTTAL